MASPAKPTVSPDGVPDEALDDLYHGPLEDFTASRNELSKSLRSDGDAEAADWVKGLAKPTRAAWLVNQLAVRKAGEVAGLLELGRELRAAQEEMLAGAADRTKLREAARREQSAASIGLVGTATLPAPATRKKKDRDAAERRARQQEAKRRQGAERKLA